MPQMALAFERQTIMLQVTGTRNFEIDLFRNADGVRTVPLDALNPRLSAYFCHLRTSNSGSGFTLEFCSKLKLAMRELYGGRSYWSGPVLLLQGETDHNKSIFLDLTLGLIKCVGLTPLIRPIRKVQNKSAKIAGFLSYLSLTHSMSLPPSGLFAQ